MKTCSRCHKAKNLFDFHHNKTKRDGLSSFCKDCMSKYSANYQMSNNVKYRYRLSQDNFDELFIKQNGVCAICGLSESQFSKYGKIKRLSIDHCHKTDKIRGLLCVACNTGLGGFKDNIDIMASAISYLQA